LNHLPNFTSEFNKYGFQYRYTDNNTISYFGNIETENYGTVCLEFRFKSKNLTRFPKVYICKESREKFTPYHFPHLDDTWELCYEDGSRVFNPYQFESMVNFSINEVRDLIDSTIIDNMKEIASEFMSYWKPTSSEYYYYGMISKSSDKAHRQHKWILDNKDLLNLKIDTNYFIPIYKIEKLPPLDEIEWPITSVSTFLKWIDKSVIVVNNIRKYLYERISNYKPDTCIILKIDEFDYYLVVLFHFSNPLLLHQKKQPLRRRTVDSIILGKHKIERGWIENHSPESLVGANNIDNSPNLINTRILLIGAGTIGSNLASILVKNGAGVGTLSKFVIVDPDIYSPYNYSRHLLGITSTGNNKAKELAEKILLEAPYIKVVGEGKDVQSCDFEDYDLIIDSTGEESLTTWINEKMKTLVYKPQFIATWIRGSGEAVECFSMSKDSGGGCHECYRNSDFIIDLKDKTRPLRDSCRSVYVPFPISASLYASLLSIEVINRWLKKEIPGSYIFQQRISPVQNIEVNCLPKSEACPVCGNHCMKG
jgi:hypothetical protein